MAQSTTGLNGDPQAWRLNSFTGGCLAMASCRGEKVPGIPLWFLAGPKTCRSPGIAAVTQRCAEPAIIFLVHFGFPRTA